MDKNVSRLLFYVRLVSQGDFMETESFRNNNYYFFLYFIIINNYLRQCLWVAANKPA